MTDAALDFWEGRCFECVHYGRPTGYVSDAKICHNPESKEYTKSKGTFDSCGHFTWKGVR